jgi:hypothetical protein
MKRRVAAAFAALALAACGPPVEKLEKAPPPAADIAPATEVVALPDPTGACAAKASYVWSPAGGGAYEITGAAAGPTCDSGSAVITIRNRASGKVLVSESVDVAVMTNTIFADAKSPGRLKTALGEWIGHQAGEETTGDLPAWAADADAPQAGEFPFYPEAGMTRAAYEALRAAKRPTYCYVQGGESLACWALDREKDAMTKAGLQTFPG